MWANSPYQLSCRSKILWVTVEGMFGRTLLHYEILEELGEGGMGSVKVLSRDKLADASPKQRFVQETQAAFALNHPDIVVIHISS